MPPKTILAGSSGNYSVEDRATLGSDSSATEAGKQLDPASFSSTSTPSECIPAPKRKTPAEGGMRPAAARPPSTYNMGGQNTKTLINIGFRDFWAGLDWLTVNLWVDFGGKWDSDTAKEKNWVGGNPNREREISIRQVLESAKELAEANGEASVGELGGQEFKMMPGGARLGKNGKGKYFRYSLRMDFGTLLIADQSIYRGNWMNVVLMVPGTVCLTYPGGAIAAHDAALQWIAGLDVLITEEKISRVDLCADFPGMGMEAFWEAFQRGNYHRRSKATHSHESNGYTVAFGASPLYLRIYDKKAELAVSALRGDAPKFEHMIQKRWGGEIPDKACRVEFQIGRDWLKKRGIDTIYDLEQDCGKIARYLCWEWIWFTAHTPDPNHPDRDEVLPEWEIVRETFAANLGAGLDPLRDVDPEEVDTKQLWLTILGMCKKVARCEGWKVPDKKITASIEAKYEFDGLEDFVAFAAQGIKLASIQRKDSWPKKQKKEKDNGIVQ